MEGKLESLQASKEEQLDLLTIDGKSLQELLESGSVTTLGLVSRYLAQIEKYDAKFHAMIAVAPRELLKETAKSLDEERALGKTRGPLHGIPIIIKVGN